MSPSAARDAPLPSKGDYTLWDAKTRYLGLRIHAGGSKVWIVQKKLGKSPCKVKLGEFPEMTYTKACSLVADVVAKISKGIDPNLEKRQRVRATAEARRQESFTVTSCFTTYIASKADPSNKPRTVTIADLNRSLGRVKDSKISTVPLVALTGALLDDYFGETANNAKRLATNVGRTQAGRDLRYLRAAYNHCAERYALQLPEKNPFLALNKLRPKWYTVKAKTRYVGRTEGQLKKWWEAVESIRPPVKHDVLTKISAADSPKKRARPSRDVMADYLQLSVMWGGRRTATLSLTWDSVNLEERVVCIPGEDTKNGEEHMYPITRFAGQLLEKRHRLNLKRDEPSPWVFPSDRKNKVGVRSHVVATNSAVAAVVKACGVDFSEHDLRRTFASLFNETGANQYVVQTALQHTANDTASKHYVQSRMAALRTAYQEYEDKLLLEAGVLVSEAPNVSVNAEDFAQFQAWRAEQTKSSL